MLFFHDLFHKIRHRPLRAPGQKSAFEKFFNGLKWYLMFTGLFTFSMFILEESLQTAMFGIWPAKNAKQWANVKRGLDLMEKINWWLKVVNYTGGWIQPLGFISYKAYNEAADSFIQGSIAEVLANEPDLYVNCKIQADFIPKKIEALEDGTWLAINGRMAVKVKTMPSLGEAIHVEGILHKAGDRLVIE
jgi:hypothetical protein